MINRLLWLCLACFVWSLAALAQENKLIKELQNKRGDLQKQIAEQETLLKRTGKDVGSMLDGLASLNGQIEERKRYIQVINGDLERIDREQASLNRQLTRLRAELKDKKKKYEASVQYLYKNRSIEEKLMFIFSAKTLEQTYRRMRYVREYATWQRMQGEEIKRKQQELTNKQEELRRVRAAKESLMAEGEAEKKKLEEQEKQKKDIVAGLRRKQKSLQQELARKRREANQLNARIDKLIAEEIEKARKRAEEEARREAEARRKAAAANKKGDAGTSSSASGKPSKAAPMERFNMNRADRTLSGSFAENKGRLPVPITGPYLITSHYGQYSVEGLRNVKLDNKGIDLQGKPGARARAVFNGRVAAVFKLNGLFNILVRHGAYITVYCNLSTATVKQDDEVKTGQTLGEVFSDGADDGRTVLHFQLRREKEKLNPEPWLAR